MSEPLFDTDLTENVATVSQALGAAESVEDIGLVVRMAARRLAGSEGATFVLAEDGKCFYADEDSIAPLWKGQRFPMTECLSGWAMMRGEIAVVDDIEVDPRIPLEAYLPTYVRSVLMVPVGQPPVAAIGCYWSTKGAAGRAPAQDLSSLAGHVADALSRVGLEDAPWAPNFSS